MLTVVFILLLPNMSVTITGTSKKNNINNSLTSFENEKNNKENFPSDIIQNAPRYYNRQSNSPWPMFHHDLNHTGRSQYDTSMNNGQKKWDFATGYFVDSSPVIGSDGTIYFGSGDSNLYALFPNGTKKWVFTTGGGSHVEYSSPAIGSDGTIYVVASDGKLYALYPSGTKKGDFTIMDGVASSPVIGTDGTIYVGSEDNKLYALYPNGTKKWNFVTGNMMSSSPAISSDGTIYFGSMDNKIYALFPNGTKKWNFATGSGVASSPAIGSDGTIYVGSSDDKLYAIFPNGTKKWDFTTENIVSSSAAIGSDGTIYVGSFDYKLYAIFPNGTKKWDFATGDEVSSSPAIGSDGTIYVGAHDNRLYAIFPNGTKKWDFVTGNWVSSSPAIGSDGTIYFGSDDFKLYAIGKSVSTAPQNLKAIGNNAQVDLTWTAPSYGGSSAITNYTIYRGTISGYETFLIKIGNLHTYKDKSVTNGQKYYYEVTANNALGESPKSNEANATPLKNGWPNSSWPMFRHDLNHTGRSQYDTSMNNGQKKWDFTTESFIRSSPAIGSDGIIYVGSYDGKLYALFPNGTKNWDYATGSYIDSSPTIGSDGAIYVGSNDGKLYSIFPNGTKKWDFATGKNVYSSPVIGADGTIYIGSEDNKLYTLYPNGTKKWDFITANAVSSTPAIGSDGTIYIGSNDFKLYALYPNGTKKWTFVAGDLVYSSPAIGSEGTIYVGSGDGKLFALHPNGTKKWQISIGWSVTSSPAIGSDGTIYIGSSDGKLYAIYPNGTKKWVFATGNIVLSSPATGSDGTIYIGSGDDKLYAIYPNGTKKWDFTTGNIVASSPAIGSDGTIYVGSFDYKLYAIGISDSTAPQDLKAIGSNAQVDLTWTAPSYGGASAITNYTIYRGTISGCETFLIKIGNLHTYKDKGVTNGQKYYYEVTANNTLGESPRSNEANATPATTPTAPQYLTDIPGNTQIFLNWKAPVDNGGAAITNYTIYRNGTRFRQLGKIVTYTDSGLVNGVTYSYNISALNSIGEGPKSIGVQATPRTIPTAPQNLHATPGNAWIVLTWIVPASNGGAKIANYSIYRGTTPGGETLFVKNYTGGTSWIDTHIAVHTQYFYMVSAVNAAGEGPKSNEVNMIAGASPGVPTELTASGGNAQVLLRWSTPTSGGTSLRYNIYRSDSQTGTYTLIASSTTREYRDRGLTNGHNYWYKINAQNSYGISGNTTAISAKPYVTSTIIIGPFLLGLIIVIIVVILIAEAMKSSNKKKTKPRPVFNKKKRAGIRSQPGRAR